MGPTRLESGFRGAERVDVLEAGQQEFSPKREPAWSKSLLAAGAVLIVLLSFAVPRAGFWNPDEGLRWLQADNGGGAIRYPLRAFDPGLRVNALHPGMTVTRGERVYAKAPPAYAVVTAGLSKAARSAAPRLVTVASALAVLLATWFLARAIAAPRAGAAACLAVLAAPVLPYAYVSWEAMPALAFALGAIALIACPRRAVFAALAGVLAGTAFAFSEEYLLLGIVLAVLQFLRRNRPAAISFAAAFVVCAAAVIAANLAMIGTPFYALVQPSVFWRTRAAVLYRTLFSATGSIPADVTLGYFVGSLALVMAMRPAFRPAVLLGGIWAALIVRFFTWNPGEPFVRQLAASGIVAVAPAALMGFAGTWARATAAPGAGFRRALLAFAALVVVLAPADAMTTLQFGPRVLLVLYPVLMLFAWRNAAALAAGSAGGVRWIILVVAGLLFAVGIADNAVFVQRLIAKKQLSQSIAALVEEAAPLPVITDLPWLGQEVAPLYYTRPILRATDDGTSTQAVAMARRMSRDGAVLFTAGVPAEAIQEAGSVSPLSEVATLQFPDTIFSFQTYLLRWKR
jgi:hypothetical protein